MMHETNLVGFGKAIGNHERITSIYRAFMAEL